jgi:RimJ/RimL family protein N-acetyltransferase
MPSTAIDTPRLSLRPHSLDDFTDSIAMWADPDVVRHISGKPSTEEEVWSRLLRYAGHWSLMGFGYWAVRERATGRFVGEVGLANFHRALDVPFHGLPEAGWVLAPWAHGQGFASEAVAVALEWAETHFGSPRAWCIIAPENGPSIRVAQKAGFREHSRTTFHGDPTIVFER